MLPFFTSIQLSLIVCVHWLDKILNFWNIQKLTIGPLLISRDGIWVRILDIGNITLESEDNTLLKTFDNPFKFECKILGPYLKNSVRYRNLKNLSFRDFVLPWLTEIPITRSIFEIQGSYFGFIPLFMYSILFMFSNLGSMTNANFHFLVPPPRGVGVKNFNS